MITGNSFEEGTGVVLAWSKGGFIALYSDQERGCGEVRVGLFFQGTNGRTGVICLKLYQRRKISLLKELSVIGIGCPRQVESPSLEPFKRSVGVALGDIAGDEFAVTA